MSNNVNYNNYNHYYYIIIVSITVKPLLSGHLRDLPKCLLNRGCPLNRGFKNCTMFVNDQPPPFPTTTAAMFLNPKLVKWKCQDFIEHQYCCSVQGARFLPYDDLKSTMKQDCFSLSLDNCLLMHTRPTVDYGFYGHC